MSWLRNGPERDELGYPNGSLDLRGPGQHVRAGGRLSKSSTREDEEGNGGSKG